MLSILNNYQIKTKAQNANRHFKAFALFSLLPQLDAIAQAEGEIQRRTPLNSENFHLKFQSIFPGETAS